MPCLISDKIQFQSRSLVAEGSHSLVDLRPELGAASIYPNSLKYQGV